MFIEQLNPTPSRADWDKGGASEAPISRSYTVVRSNRRLRQADFAPKLLTIWKIKDEDLVAALHVRNPKLITCKLLLGVVLAVHLSMNGKVGAVLNNARVGNALFWCIGALGAVLIGLTGWQNGALHH